MGWGQMRLFLWDFHLQGLSLFNPITWVVCDPSPGPWSPQAALRADFWQKQCLDGPQLSAGTHCHPVHQPQPHRAGGDLDPGLSWWGRGCPALPAACSFQGRGRVCSGPLQPQAPASSTFGVSSGLSSLSLTLLPLLMNLHNPDNRGYHLEILNFIASAKSFCPVGSYRSVYPILQLKWQPPDSVSVHHSWGERLALLLAPGAPCTLSHLTPPARGPSCPGAFARPSFCRPSPCPGAHGRALRFTQPGTQLRPPW